MAAQTNSTPTEYIGHHLTFTSASRSATAASGRSTSTPSSLSILLGVIGFGFLWWVVRGATAGVPGKRQAFVELLRRLRRRPGQRHLPRRPQLRRAARAHHVRVGDPDERDGLPAGRHRRAGSTTHVFRQHNWRTCRPPTSTRPSRSRSRCGADDLLQRSRSRAWRLDPRALLRAVRRRTRCCGRPTSCSTWSSTSPSRCRTRCGCSATCTRARSSSCCCGCGRRPAGSARSSASCSALGWAIFHILIVVLQAYIFMMLTIVYIVDGARDH